LIFHLFDYIFDKILFTNDKKELTLSAVFVGSHVCQRIISIHRAHVSQICSWQSSYPLYSQNGSPLLCSSSFSFLPNHLILSYRIRHFHSKHPIYFTTPCPSTNCRRSAAHPHSCRSQTSWLWWRSHKTIARPYNLRFNTIRLHDRYQHVRKTRPLTFRRPDDCKLSNAVLIVY